MSNLKTSRREFMKRGAATGLALAAGRSFAIGSPAERPSRRIVILGFDGMEPGVVEEMLARNALPNLAKLKERGGYSRLATTTPPQSPVAWTSFATCKNPGGHGIFDFIRRDPGRSGGPLPCVGTGSFEPVKLGPDGAVLAPPSATGFRKGDTFWSVADAQGLRCKVLNVPFAFPPDRLEHGVMLCGLGTPDLRGTTSTFVSLSEAFTDEDLRGDLSGGLRLRLAFDGSGNALVQVPGSRDARHKYSDPRGFTPEPLRLTVDRSAHRGRAVTGRGGVDLVEGEWSSWVEWAFAPSERYAVHGISRFFPIEIRDRVRLYMSCLQFHPRHPYVPFTSPDRFASELADRYGLFKTVGWAYDTHALRQDALHEEAFLKDVEQTMGWRERLTLDEIDRGDFDILISAWTATDRVGHMFWHHRDSGHPLHNPEAAKKYARCLEETYARADAIVGRVAEKLTEDDWLIVLSDHGFGSWRTGFNVNGWLAEQGYLSVSDPKAAQQGFLQGLDWSKTRAYALGLSSLYLNVKGRESRGTVDPSEAGILGRELREKLLEFHDPSTGAKVFREVHTRAEYRGEAMADAPDICLGYESYYQSTKCCAKGGVGTILFEPNDDKWSGEHAASAASLSPGVLFSSRRIGSNHPDIRDLGSTALAALGRDVPGDFEGSPLLEPRA